jgi:cytochrome c oxidase assembly factor 3, fungi type
MSPGLKRARQPFFLRNLLTGVVLAGFSVGVWAYSIGAVKQEDFTDIDEEAKALRAQQQQQQQVHDGVKETEKRVAEAVSTFGEAELSPQSTSPPASPVSRVVAADVKAGAVTAAGRPPRGVVASLLWERYPGMFDPKTKTLVWGAPPVDRIGRVGDEPPSSS